MLNALDKQMVISIMAAIMHAGYTGSEEGAPHIRTVAADAHDLYDAVTKELNTTPPRK